MILFGTTYTPTFAKNHARIGYDNVIPSATVTGSTEESGFPADAVKNQMTYELWRPTAVPATLTATFDEQIIDYVGIAAHNLGDSGSTVAIEYQQDGNWIPMEFGLPDTIGETLDFDFTTQQFCVFDPISDNSALLYQFAPVQCTGIRITVDGAIASVGVIYAGRMLEMYRPFYAGFSPGSLSRKTTIRPNKSVNGQWLGRSVLREGLKAQFNWENTPLSWYQLNVDPFSRAAIDAPFFIAWNAKTHPDHVMYAWTSEDIAPETTGTLNYVSFGFSAEGVE